MVSRIAVYSRTPDARAKVLLSRLNAEVYLADVYTLEKKLSKEQLQAVAQMLTNPVTQVAVFNTNKPFISDFDWAIEMGFLPGVTDNVATTAREGICDLLRTDFSDQEGVYYSQVLYLKGKLSLADVRQKTESLINPVIQRLNIKSHAQFLKDGGMDVIVPRVKLEQKPRVDVVDLEVDDQALTEIGKLGIANADGTRRGPLALDLAYMKAIQAYFAKIKRQPTDVELESIAQTWSEHCKHTIFADPIDEIKNGLYKTYIKAATNQIRKKKGKKDICLSVFTDNSGGIIFDEKYMVTHKAETHNSPSALDPFGGSITGIVGVNRDAIGFGKGAKPVINVYGFCLADPRDETPLYRSKDKKQKMLSPRRIMDGVIAGVNSGGNCSGIPTPQGFLAFDSRYKGKPLVFVGTVGLIPRTIKGKLSDEKQAKPGDYIVMVGGRVGLDGIHGATFSSEALDTGSPATAVQIGDPITQKKLSDALVKEARDRNLYTSITDNGAGGLSCSVAEMAKECGGCLVNLEKVPVKYPGLEPWQIWISESQERMTLSVSKSKWLEFQKLMQARGVEVTIIGKFTSSGKCVVHYGDQVVMDVAMKFLHDGLPVRPLSTTYTPVKQLEPKLLKDSNLTEVFLELFTRPNISSFAFISKQYDHEVQGGSVVKPLQGRGEVNGEVSVTRPVLPSPKGVALSQGIIPWYSDLDTYHMAAAAIDTAMRNLVAVGADPEKIALLDNFCWCSSTEPERLGQLKQAVKACYDYAVAYETPFISGKDSMFNDFKGYDENGEPIKISIPPTLLISSIVVLEDSEKAVTLDVKMPGDLIYVLGKTKAELGGSEYYQLLSQHSGKLTRGNSVPVVDAKKNSILYHNYYQAVQKGLIASAISIGRGGLGVALGKSLLAGKRGAQISIKDIILNTAQETLFSESQGRLLVTVAPENQKKFESIMQKSHSAYLGLVTYEQTIQVMGRKDQILIHCSVEEVQTAYRSLFKDY